MPEEKRQHLEFIQNAITRMNTNSFQIKGISITLVSALLAIYVSKPNVLFIFIGIIPTFIFWLLDAYYLQQERKFRGIYDDVIGKTTNNTILDYHMPLNKYTEGKYNFFRVMTSTTIILIYLPIIIFLGTIGKIILNQNVC
jgi:hypothetical protein